MTTINELVSALEQAWCKETSANPNWTPENPSLGQCAVTALVVQDYVGGTLLWAEAQLPDGSTDSHYFNEVCCVEVDLTRDQFPEGTVVPEGKPKPKDFATTRDYVLSYEPTQERYELLSSKVKEILGN